MRCLGKKKTGLIIGYKTILKCDDLRTLADNKAENKTHHLIVCLVNLSSYLFWNLNSNMGLESYFFTFSFIYSFYFMTIKLAYSIILVLSVKQNKLI